MTDIKTFLRLKKPRLDKKTVTQNQSYIHRTMTGKLGMCRNDEPKQETEQIACLLNHLVAYS